MDRTQGERIVASAMTVSDKIRALDAAGYPRAEIARALGKRYQHVRNVLEGDKLGKAPPQESGWGGVEEGAQAFDDVRRLMVDADGRAWIPADVVAALGGHPGGVLIALAEPDRLAVLSSEAALSRVQAVLAAYNSDPSQLASEQLIAERRAEAIREELE